MSCPPKNLMLAPPLLILLYIYLFLIRKSTLLVCRRMSAKQSIQRRVGLLSNGHTKCIRVLYAPVPRYRESSRTYSIGIQQIKITLQIILYVSCFYYIYTKGLQNLSSSTLACRIISTSLTRFVL